jgi:hypothetical protein
MLAAGSWQKLEGPMEAQTPLRQVEGLLHVWNGFITERKQGIIVETSPTSDAVAR